MYLSINIELFELMAPPSGQTEYLHWNEFLLFFTHTTNFKRILKRQSLSTVNAIHFYYYLFMSIPTYNFQSDNLRFKAKKNYSFSYFVMSYDLYQSANCFTFGIGFCNLRGRRQSLGSNSNKPPMIS